MSVGDGVCAIREDGTIGCWGQWYDVADADLPTGSGYVEAAAGTVQGCALHEAGTIACWEIPIPKK